MLGRTIETQPEQTTRVGRFIYIYNMCNVHYDIFYIYYYITRMDIIIMLIYRYVYGYSALW